MSDLESKYREQTQGIQPGNTGRYGGTSSEVQGQPIPDTKYVDTGFQVESLILPVGVFVALIAAAVVTYLLTKRVARKA